MNKKTDYVIDSKSSDEQQQFKQMELRTSQYGD